VCGIIIVIKRVGVDMLSLWYNYWDSCWGGRVKCMYIYCETTFGGGHVSCVV
jgi:hypothetical protein